MDKNIYHCFYPLIFFCLVCLEYIPPILLSCIMCSSLRDDHKRSKRTRIALMRRICSFTDFYLMHLDYVRHWRMDSYGFSLRLRQSSAVRRKEIRNKSKSKWNPWKDKIRRIGFIRDRFWTLAKEPIGSWALMGRNINKQKPKIQ